MTYANGVIPSSALADISTPGDLLKDAAASFERLRAAAKADGFNMGTSMPDHAYRSVAKQATILRQNYDHTPRAGLTVGNGGVKYWNGQTWYKKPGYAVASTPGQSNHGYGVAVDFQGLGGFGGAGFAWMAKHAGNFGWNNVQGRSIGEPWHWVYVAANDKHRNDKPPTPPKPTPKEDDMKVKEVATTKKQAVTSKAWHTLKINKETNDVSILTAPHDSFESKVQLTITDLAVGAVVQARFVIYDVVKAAITKRYPIEEIHGTTGNTYGSLSQISKIGKNERLRVMYVGPDGASITAVRVSTLYSA